MLVNMNMLTTGSCKELERELAVILGDTVKGMERLSCFLEAVEKLAVTSLHMFLGEEITEMLCGSCLKGIEARISMSRVVCPHLLQFKRDASAFFLPDLHNVDVFVVELDQYIQSTEKICSTVGVS